MKWNKLVFGTIGVLAFLTLFSLTPTQAGELISFITPPAGGGAYITGAGIVTVTNKYLSDIKLVHEASSGTMDIVRRMMQKEAEKKDAFGIFGSVDAWRAYKGEGEYAGKPFTGLRAVVFNMGTDLYFVVPGNSPIKVLCGRERKADCYGRSRQHRGQHCALSA